jgi:hypothetical protein
MRNRFGRPQRRRRRIGTMKRRMMKTTNTYEQEVEIRWTARMSLTLSGKNKLSVPKSEPSLV